ncbi:hypothetical protein CKM354_000438300 [Cercospora kikuchii]|uniref:Nephrocystin 3-like N-terminal domain-containing protein n=1 Tax=Cercospora kikuchii TaxID=84275 RepID=A0A9P3CD57_9PEZI|nr:uncharacterized protein CKM354_000438300 [Cercospora kikuchii]GIZ41067.1 hypothetical protein CKM354_000438300 [Cercospora kikuchii]
MSIQRNNRFKGTGGNPNSQNTEGVNVAGSQHFNIGLAARAQTHDDDEVTAWLDEHAAQSAEWRLPNYFQGTLLDRIINIFREDCVQGDYKTLILYGPAGVGKTTISKGFIEWILACYRKEPAIELAYILFDHGKAQHNARKVLLRILRWLVGHEHPLNGKSFDAVQDDFAKCSPQEEDEWLPTESSCGNLILDAMTLQQRRERRFCIVLDAVDEFTNKGELQALSEQLLRLQEKLNLTVVLTTRFEDQPICKTLARPRFEGIAAEPADIKRFAAVHFAISPGTVINSLHLNNPKCEEITNSIVTASRNIFSSAQLHVGYITSARSLDELQRFHDYLTAGLSDNARQLDPSEKGRLELDRNLRRVLGTTLDVHEGPLSIDQEEILHIFACVLFARRPLTIRELWATVEHTLRPDIERHETSKRSRELYLRTCGLIDSDDDEEHHKVDFTHPHLRAYLNSKEEWRRQKWRIAQSCIDYLGLPVLGKAEWCTWHIYKQTVSGWPFVRYAAKYWHHHYGELGSSGGPGEGEIERFNQIVHSATQFLSTPKNVDFVSLVMTQIGVLSYPNNDTNPTAQTDKEKLPSDRSDKEPMVWYDHQKPYGLNGLPMASMLGMSRLVERLLDRTTSQDKNRRTIRNETAAYLAAISGDVSTLQLIITRGLAATTLNVCDTEGFPLICRAMFHERKEIVHHLLKNHQHDVDFGAQIQCEKLEEPYSFPGFGGLTDLKGIAYRLRGYTLLHQASAAGDLEIAEKLLQCHVDPNVRDALGMTPLHKAAKYGHLGIVKLLIEKGRVDAVKHISKDGRTALHMASKYGHEPVSRYLTEKFPKLASVKTPKMGLARDHAIMAGSQEIAMMLLRIQSKTPGFVSRMDNLTLLDDTAASLLQRYKMARR